MVQNPYSPFCDLTASISVFFFTFLTLKERRSKLSNNTKFINFKASGTKLFTGLGPSFLKRKKVLYKNNTIDLRGQFLE